MGESHARPMVNGASVSGPGATRPFDGSTRPKGRYPHLQAVFERMMESCSDYLRQVSAVPAQYALTDVQTERFGKVLDECEGNAVAAIFHSPEWDARLLFLVDRGFVFTLVEMLFGGDGSEPPCDDVRPFSEIEVNLTKTVVTEAAKALQDAFSSIAGMTLKFERLETRLDFAVIERRANPAVVARLSLSALQRGGDLLIVVPQSALDSIRETLSQEKPKQQAAADPGWSQRMQTEIKNTGVVLKAILEEQQLSLAAVASLKVGQVLPLEAGPRSRIRLECNDRPLFWCEVGQADGAYTLRVDNVVEKASRMNQ